MSGSAHRIVLTNCVLLNTGDAAIALGILDRVADALDNDVSFVVAGNAAEVSARYYPHLELRTARRGDDPPASRHGRLGPSSGAPASCAWSPAPGAPAGG